MSNFQILQHQAIASLVKNQFQQFIANKMYKINKNFNSSHKCIDKLVTFIKEMSLNKQTIKIAKNVIKYYGVGIIVFFQPFYQKIKTAKNQIDHFKTNNVSIQQVQQKCKILQKLLQKCKQVSLICQKIIQPFQIQYLNFVNVLGGPQKLLIKQSSRNAFQHEYLQFLQKVSSKYSHAISKNAVQQYRAFMNWIETQRISREFNTIQLFNINQLKNKIKIKIQKLQVVPKKMKDLKSSKQQLFKIPLCCRRFFFQNQQILVAQNLNLQYKNYRFPYDSQRTNAIRRTICGFLNGSGGTILIGVYESSQNKKKFVKGEFYSENKKQKVLVEFRYICDLIYPKIVNGQMYSVKFVPIKTDKGDFIKGKYVLRIKIKVGSRQDMYSYINDGENIEYLAFRTANEILKRSLNQDILKLYRQRLQNSQPMIQTHSGECLPPQLGIPIFVQKYQEQQCQIEQAISLSLQEKIANQQKGKATIEKLKNSQNNINNESDKISVNVQQQTQTVNREKKNWIIDQDQEQYKKKKSLQKKLRLIEQKQKQNQKSKNVISFRKANSNNLNQLIDVNQNNPKKYRQKQSKNNYVIFKDIPQKAYLSSNMKIDCFDELLIKNKLNNNYDDIQSFNQQPKKQKQYVKKQNKINSLSCKSTEHQSWNVLLQYLFLGIPFKQIQKITKQYQLPLTDKSLIKCKSDIITWLRIKKSQVTVEKVQEIKQALKLKKNDFPNFQFTIASCILSTKQNNFKIKLRMQNFIQQKNQQDQSSIFIFQETYEAIKAFLKCWTPGQTKIRFTRDKKKQEKQKIMNILK